jgi:hypothetical protein
MKKLACDQLRPVAGVERREIERREVERREEGGGRSSWGGGRREEREATGVQFISSAVPQIVNGRG